ncbi:hypothetical protein BT63DRAFT_410359 [Microthyrium microscopicum]|uniref:Uncharacterized protein n=1 Tax=Microthyrium microscopicum TaxID=703497 RepID=A0A6A6UPE4_9PEZI|nr:hypothetical protein BT63DRAFT_410359 [Microthyrium microscopicum]
MSHNFAPYQDTAPDIERTLSPPATKSPSPRPQAQPPRRSPGAFSPPKSPSYQNNETFFNPGQGWPTEEADDDLETGRQRTLGSAGGFWSRRSGIDLYETSLGLRLDWEACLAYLGLPPAGPVILLLFEHRSDYVRFHAWQSALTFSVLFVLHIIFSWSRILSYLILVGDLGLIGFMTFRAYKDAETVDRFQIPIFGRIANSILDDE